MTSLRGMLIGSFSKKKKKRSLTNEIIKIALSY